MGAVRWAGSRARWPPRSHRRSMPGSRGRLPYYASNADPRAIPVTASPCSWRPQGISTSGRSDRALTGLVDRSVLGQVGEITQLGRHAAARHRERRFATWAAADRRPWGEREAADAAFGTVDVGHSGTFLVSCLAFPAVRRGPNPAVPS